MSRDGDMVWCDGCCLTMIVQLEAVMRYASPTVEDCCDYHLRERWRVLKRDAFRRDLPQAVSALRECESGPGDAAECMSEADKVLDAFAADVPWDHHFVGSPGEPAPHFGWGFVQPARDLAAALLRVNRGAGSSWLLVSDKWPSAEEVVASATCGRVWVYPTDPSWLVRVQAPDFRRRLKDFPVGASLLFSYLDALGSPESWTGSRIRGLPKLGRPLGSVSGPRLS